MIFHLMTYSRISEEFVKYINKKFDNSKHKFIFWRPKNGYSLELDNMENITILKSKCELLKFYLQLYRLKKAKKIIIHGWYWPRFSIFLFLNSYLLKKIYWRIWGGDNRIFLSRKYNFSIKNNLEKFFDDFCKFRVIGYVSHIKSEYDLIINKKKVKGRYIDAFLYPQDIVKEFKEYENKKLNNEYNIQIGNSAQEREHLNIMYRLQNYKPQISKIYCPLSYGNSDNYIENLLENIPEDMNEKCIPMLELLPYEEYIKFLSKIDISIFGFKRQQAFGNILNLISLKKTIYLNKDSLTYKHLVEIGIKVKKLEDLKENLSILNREELEKNKEIIGKLYSEEKLISDLNFLFT